MVMAIIAVAVAVTVTVTVGVVVVVVVVAVVVVAREAWFCRRSGSRVVRRSRETTLLYERRQGSW